MCCSYNANPSKHEAPDVDASFPNILPSCLVAFPALLAPKLLQYCSAAARSTLAQPYLQKYSAIVNMQRLVANADPLHTSISRSGKRGHQGAMRPHIAGPFNNIMVSMWTFKLRMRFEHKQGVSRGLYVACGSLAARDALQKPTFYCGAEWP